MTDPAGSALARPLWWRHRYAILFLAVATPLYLIWAWSDQIGFLGSDGPAYLVMAQHYAGVPEPGSTGDIAGTYSRFSPLYPIVLAALHAAQDLVLAHAVSMVMLLLGLLALYTWLYLESGWAEGAALVMLSFAALRASWLLALSLQSEFLYLLLSCAALAALAAYRRQPRAELFQLAALAVSAALMTRPIAVALLPALVVAAWGAPLRTWLSSALITLAPTLLWHLLHRSGVGYSESFLVYYRDHPWGLLMQQLGVELPALREAAESGVSQQAALHGVIDVLFLLSLAAAAWRAAMLKPDAVYIAGYVAVVLVWPFDTNDTQRFLWPVLGLLLAQPVLLLPQWRAARTRPWARRAGAVPAVLILLLAVPELALAAERYGDAASSGIPGARGIRYWYDADPARARRRSAGEALETGMLRDLGREVPPGECVIAIRPDLIHYFAGRMSGLPPDDGVPDAQFQQRLHHLHCGYIFMTTARFTGYAQPLHPLQKLDGQIDVIDYRELPPAAPGDGRVICMLARFKQP